MTENMGNTDRVIRVFVGLVLIFAPLMNFMGVWSNSIMAYGSMIVGAILIVTSVVRFCPIYRLVGVSTCKT